MSNDDAPLLLSISILLGMILVQLVVMGINISITVTDLHAIRQHFEAQP